MRKAIIIATTVAAALVTAPQARGDDVQLYLDLLHSRGIWAARGDGTLVRAGLEICDRLDVGRTPMSVAREVYAKTDESITSEDAGFIVGAAIRGLCPEHTPIRSLA